MSQVHNSAPAGLYWLAICGVCRAKRLMNAAVWGNITGLMVNLRAAGWRIGKASPRGIPLTCKSCAQMGYLAGRDAGKRIGSKGLSL